MAAMGNTPPCIGIEQPPDPVFIKNLKLDPKDFFVSFGPSVKTAALWLTTSLVCLGACICLLVMMRYGLLILSTMAFLLCLMKSIWSLTYRITFSLRNGRFEAVKAAFLVSDLVLECRTIKTINVLPCDPREHTVGGLSLSCDAPFPRFPREHCIMKYTWQTPMEAGPGLCVLEPPRDGQFHLYQIDVQLPTSSITWLANSLSVAAQAQGVMGL